MIKQEKMTMKFDHYHLVNGSVLTICTMLDKENFMYHVGYTLCNTEKDVFVKKIGNTMALERLNTYPLCVDLYGFLTEEELTHYYLSHVAVQAVMDDIERTQYRTGGVSVKFAKDSIKAIGYLLYDLETRIENMKDDVEEDTIMVVPDIMVSPSAIDSNDVIIYDSSHRYVPINRIDIPSVIEQLTAVDTLPVGMFRAVDPTRLS